MGKKTGQQPAGQPEPAPGSANRRMPPGLGEMPRGVVENARPARACADAPFYGMGHVLCALLPLFCVLLLLYALLGGDSAVNEFFRARRDAWPRFTSAIKFYTIWGNLLAHIFYGLLFIWAWRKGRRGLLALALAYGLVQIAVSVFILRFIKISIGRPRPQVGGPWRGFDAWHPRYQSMPSGHTTEVIIAALPLALYARQYCFTALAGAHIALMGFSRIYVDMHYPSDVMAGLFCGLAGAMAVEKVRHSKRVRGWAAKLAK